MKRVVITIDGMSCGHCLSAVQRALSSLSGVDLESVRMGRAELQYDPVLTDLIRISAVVQSAGYPVGGLEEVPA